MGARQHPFDLLMELDTPFVKLDCAALQLARDVYPHIDIPRYLSQLDALATEIADQRPGLDALARYEAMRDVIVDRHHFIGNGDDYYDPDNSYLNRVLDRGLGAPITLSIIWIEVARRLKWPVCGLNFPGHFLVRFDDPERFVIADPFERGESLSLDDCRALLREHAGVDIRLERHHLQPADTRRTIASLLSELRRIYLVNNDWKRLERTLHRLAAAEPDNHAHLCELASLHARLGDMRRAYAHLAVCLERAPAGRDTEVIRHSLSRIEATILALN